jgi:hypothetical protein
MLTLKSKFATLAAAAFVSLIGFAGVPSGANAETRYNDSNIQNTVSDSRANRQLRSRGGLRNEGSNWNNRRYYGNNYSNRGYRSGYGRNYYNDGYGRRYGRNNGFGIYLNLGDNNSGCGNSYRKWKNTGSRYWRSRYYNCIG